MASFIELTNFSPVLKSEYLSERLSSWFNKKLIYVGSTYQNVDEIKNNEYCDKDSVRLTIFGKSPFEKSIYKVHVILKTLPVNLNTKKLLRSVDFFQKEIAFYSKILPELLQFQANCNLTEPFDNVPRVFAMHADGVNDFILTEDLSACGYKRLENGKKLDQKHLETVIKLLAKFHAISFAFKNQRLKTFDEMVTELREVHLDQKIWKWFLKFEDIVGERVVDAVKKEYPNSIYIKKIKEFSITKTFLRIVRVLRDSKSYGCINHGQLRTSNILVKYSEDGKTPIHAVFVDFQLCCYSSPTLDLSVFMFDSVEISCGKSYEMLLQLYYDYMSRQVRDLGSQLPLIYPWHIFNIEVRKFSLFGLVISFNDDNFFNQIKKDLQNGMKRPNYSKFESSWSVMDNDWEKKQASKFKYAVDKGYV